MCFEVELAEWLSLVSTDNLSDMIDDSGGSIFTGVDDVSKSILGVSNGLH